MNLIVQPRAGAAYLLTDTACYRQDGTIAAFRSKVLAVSAKDRLSAAIATTGMALQQDQLRQRLAKAKPSTVHEFLASFPDAFRAAERGLIDAGVPSRCGSGHMSAVLALFNHETGTASGYAISNDRSLFATAPATRPYEPYTLQPVRKYLTRYVGRPLAPGTDMSDPRQWNPIRDAAALAEAQRADDFGVEPNTYPAVGGQAILTIVSAAGIKQQTVAAWGDATGGLIRRNGDNNHARWRKAFRQAVMPRLPHVSLVAAVSPSPAFLQDGT